MLPKRIKNIFKRKKKPATASFKSPGSLGNWPSGATSDNSSTPHISQFETFERRSAIEEVSSSAEEIALENEEVSPFEASVMTSETVGSLTSHQLEEEEIPVARKDEDKPFVEEETKNDGDLASKQSTEAYAVERRISASSDRVSLDDRISVNSGCSIGSGYHDPPDVHLSYKSIPLLEQITLPRGGISMDTQAVGRVQVW
jgi:hypothetical protein